MDNAALLLSNALDLLAKVIDERDKLRAALLAEREACAMECQKVAEGQMGGGYEEAALDCADMIRSRKP